MFVKVVSKESRTKALYECVSINLEREKLNAENEPVNGQRLMRLTKRLEPAGPDDDQICMAFEDGDQVFVMNEAGLTIDRYWF